MNMVPAAKQMSGGFVFSSSRRVRLQPLCLDRKTHERAAWPLRCAATVVLIMLSKLGKRMSHATGLRSQRSTILKELSSLRRAGSHPIPSESYAVEDFIEPDDDEEEQEMPDLVRDGILSRRARLRNDEAVQKALAVWWRCAVGCASPAPRTRPTYLTNAVRAKKQLNPDDVPEITKTIFVIVMAKVYKLMIPPSDFDPIKAREGAHEDWQRDLRGGTKMTKELFCDAIFELAELWAQTGRAAEYVAFLRGLLRGIAKRTDANAVTDEHADAQWRCNHDFEIAHDPIYAAWGGTQWASGGWSTDQVNSSNASTHSGSDVKRQSYARAARLSYRSLASRPSFKLGVASIEQPGKEGRAPDEHDPVLPFRSFEADDDDSTELAAADATPMPQQNRKLSLGNRRFGSFGSFGRRGSLDMELGSMRSSTDEPTSKRASPTPDEHASRRGSEVGKETIWRQDSSKSARSSRSMGGKRSSRTSMRSSASSGRKSLLVVRSIAAVVMLRRRSRETARVVPSSPGV